MKFDDIRPRAYFVLRKEDLNVDDVVFVNYNDKNPNLRGFWYDFHIKSLDQGVNGCVIAADTIIENCTVHFINEIMRIEKPELNENRIYSQYEPRKSMFVFSCVC